MTSPDAAPSKPHGELTVRTVPMPADTNSAGDIFGGWVLSQMDIAGGIAAADRARGRVATVAIEAMTFIAPVKVGDLLSVYCTVSRVGKTSLTISMETWVQRNRIHELVKVTEGKFVYVALDEAGRPRAVEP